MKIIRLKINNFLLPLLFSSWITITVLPNARAQTKPQSEGTNTSPPTVQNQPSPAEEKPDITQNTETPIKQPAPIIKPNTTPSSPKNSTEKPELPTEPPENNKQPESQTNKAEAPEKEIPDSSKNEPEPTKELDLPEVSDNETRENSSSKFEVPEKSNKSMIKTAISWLLIGLGTLIIIKVIISNLKIPKNYEPHIKNKHSSKSNKRKSKYNLKYR